MCGVMQSEQLYAANVGLAVTIAGDWHPPSGYDVGDVHQQARLALWEAARTYQPARGPFQRFACFRIHSRLSIWVRDERNRERICRERAAQQWQPELIPWHEPDFDGQMVLRLVFRRLEPRHREALYLSVAEGWQVGELAELWGCTSKQADNRVAHAKRAARRIAESLT